MNRGRAQNDGRYSAPRGRGPSSRSAGRSAHRHSPGLIIHSFSFSIHPSIRVLKGDDESWSSQNDERYSAPRGRGPSSRSAGRSAHRHSPIKIVKKCRDLSIGFGGFYDPSYRNGGKLHLKMLCLGKNWDPETSMYGDQQPIASLGSLSYPFVRKLLQILAKIVSSIYSAFPPKPPRDTDNADKEVLKSGYVLIFGGESRLIFHGVASILPDTTPKLLMDGTNMLPGRLNLTFREY
ncbi:2-oxoglutarate-dependent dioxygenase family protein [Actinidia rufa]|uniref:2-oxoglutarate-dependent dioxygenase family protein n=1 Tax=Actinidia rufa TaxID=165716 RepID=A0A7J0GLP7_9ERIC|nr:2-oxoglutarate-dependent dioxygenase family protein [Actinidia rufa]